MARITKPELQEMNDILLSRVANCVGAIKQILDMHGLPSYMRNYLKTVLINDEQYEDWLREISEPKVDE